MANPWDNFGGNFVSYSNNAGGMDYTNTTAPGQSADDNYAKYMNVQQTYGNQSADAAQARQMQMLQAQYAQQMKTRGQDLKQQDLDRASKEKLAQEQLQYQQNAITQQENYGREMGGKNAFTGAADLASQGQINTALGQYQPYADKLQGLVNQGGLFSQGQMQNQASQIAGQSNAQVSNSMADLARQMSQRGGYNPAAAQAAMSGQQGAALGAGARALSNAQWQNAQSLPGLINQGVGVAGDMAKLNTAPTWDQTAGRLAGIWGGGGSAQATSQGGMATLANMWNPTTAGATLSNAMMPKAQ